MNYLAHAWLSGTDPQWILGGYLGDHVRGGRWREYPEGVASGILLHRRIDSFVDSHEAFNRARGRLQSEFRRYSGILLDMFFDHCLARNWTRVSDVSLTDFAKNQYALLRKHRELMPDSLRRLSDYMLANDLLVQYQHAEAINRSLAGIGQRLSRSNPLHLGMEEMLRNENALNQDFDELWPAVDEFAAHLRERPESLIPK